MASIMTSRLPVCSVSWPGPWPCTSADGEYTRISSNGMRNVRPSSNSISSARDCWCTVSATGTRCGVEEVIPPVYRLADTLPTRHRRRGPIRRSVLEARIPPNEGHGMVVTRCENRARPNCFRLDMNRLLPLLALVISLPAFADMQKCVDAQGKVSYTDRDCPNAARPAAAAPALTPGTGVAPVADPLESLETGVPVIVQMPGRFAWLDDDTLAITTYADANAKAPWMVRKIGAFDVPSRRTSVLVPRGFVDCVNADHELVSLDVGDLESRFAIGSRAAPSVQQFDVWDPAARKLSPAPADV